MQDYATPLMFSVKLSKSRRFVIYVFPTEEDMQLGVHARKQAIFQLDGPVDKNFNALTITYIPGKRELILHGQEVIAEVFFNETTLASSLGMEVFSHELLHVLFWHFKKSLKLLTSSKSIEERVCYAYSGILRSGLKSLAKRHIDVRNG